MATSNSDVITPLLPTGEETVAGAVDYKRRPAVRSKHGRWRSACFIIVVEVAERFAFYGVASNLITFLTDKLGQSTAEAAVNANAWGGVALLLPILGGFVADYLLGKYYAILASSFLYILGLCLLTLSAMLPSLSCDDIVRSIGMAPRCLPDLQVLTFFVALYLVAVGEGGFKPCVQAFGADQFDGEDPEESKAKSSFFNWWYFGLTVGSTLGVAVSSYVQDNVSWVIGFGILCIIMVIALVIFLCGTMTYRYIMKDEGQGPFQRISRVFAATRRNWHASDCSVHEDEEEAYLNPPSNGSRQSRFHDNALLPPNISEGDGQICNIDEVKEAKLVLRLVPIWVTSLIFAIFISQQGTFFIRQAATLDRTIGSNFVIPAASLQCFIFICIIVVIPIYDCAFVPIARVMTGKPAGITALQRIGIGLFISIICMIVAALIERKRLRAAVEHGLIDLPNVTIPVSIWWLVPQYALSGISESFTMIGLQEFFYDQMPDELRSVGLSLYLSIFGIGSLLSSLLVSVINKATSRGGRESWFSDNLNRGHLDYFYWLIGGLSVLGLAFFVVFAKLYKYKQNTRV